MSRRDDYCLTVINLIRTIMRQGYQLRLRTKYGVTTAKLFYGMHTVGTCSRPGLNLQTVIRRAMVAAKAAGWPLYIPEQSHYKSENADGQG